MRHIIILPAIVLILAGCGDQPPAGMSQHGMPGVPVGVAAPLVRELPMTRELTGRIEAIETVDVRPRVGGLIERVLVADGAEVKAGDVLMEVDTAPLRTNAARAEADVARTEALLNQSKLAFERTKQLLASKAVSQQIYDDQEANVRTTSAQVAAAKATLDSARLDLGYARVTAPINGRIGRVLASAGNLVQGGGPVPATHLLTIVSREVYATFDLDEATWRRIGTRMQKAGAIVPVGVGLAGEQGHPHQGQVAFADNRIDEGSGSIRLRAKLVNTDGTLTPGAFARIRLETDPPRPTLLIHEQAVMAELASRMVLVVGADGSTQPRPVRLGASIGRLRVVEEGLKADERIVITNLGKLLYPGMPIQPIASSMETLEPEGSAAPTAVPAAAKPAEGHKP